MATVTVKALQAHPYNGKEYKEGDEYEYEIGDLNPDHLVLQKAVRVEKKDTNAAARDYKTRDMKAEK